MRSSGLILEPSDLTAEESMPNEEDIDLRRRGSGEGRHANTAAERQRSVEALREIARVLKLDGTLALIDPVRKPGKPPGGHHGTEVPTGQELQQMLGKAGFQSVSPRVSMGRAKAVVRKVAS
jgi:hypothetical protein